MFGGREFQRWVRRCGRNSLGNLSLHVRGRCERQRYSVGRVFPGALTFLVYEDIVVQKNEGDNVQWKLFYNVCVVQF